MNTRVSRITRKLKSFIPAMRGRAHISFSQFGEDIILQAMLHRYGVTNITYLDIGANEPITGNNTYGFYLRGHHGVLVEPNTDLCGLLKQVRPKDTILNFGIGSDVESESNFYLFENSPMSTFSQEDAKSYEQQGFPIKKVVKLPLKNINNIIRDYLNDTAPTVISLDVEGLDEMILKSLDFNKYQPLFICVETVIFTVKKELIKRTQILDFMASKGYFVYADTHVNTIFCSQKCFDQLIAANGN